MEILLITALLAAVVVTLSLLNRRDADEREIAAAIQADPRMRAELMYARDYQEAQAEMGARKKQVDTRIVEDQDELQAA